MANLNDLSKPKVVGWDGVKREGLRVKGEKREKVGERGRLRKVGESIKWVVNY